ncbi:MAG: hypothetical protein AAFU85_02370 [Planctomycetota bacterium]
MTQPTLWDTTVQPAIDRADQNADSDWKETALRLLHSIARRKDEFTADDLVEALESESVETHNPSAIGPVFLRAKKEGWIESTDQMQQTRISRRHRKLTVWRSLLKGGQE